MLVLSRKVGERILVGDEITVTVTKVNGNRVSIGIDAPKEVKICRSEVNKKAVRQQTTGGNNHPRSNSSVSDDVNVAAAPF